MKPRSYKQLLIILRDHIIQERKEWNERFIESESYYYMAFMCNVAERIFMINIISAREYHKILKFLKNNRPKDAFYGFAWWDAHDVQRRINFLNKHINSKRLNR